MEKVLDFLYGKKTYIVAVLIALVNLAAACGLVSPSQIEALNWVLGAAGLGALRAGINKV